jgi:hypothetical protein
MGSGYGYLWVIVSFDQIVDILNFGVPSATRVLSVIAVTKNE